MNLAVCVSHSVVSYSLQPHGLHQASLSTEFSRQEYWSGLPLSSPEELPNSGIEPWSPASQADSLPFELQGSPMNLAAYYKYEIEGGKEQAKLTPSWKRRKLHLPSQWTLDYTPAYTFSELWTVCLVAMGITYLWPNWPPGLINTRFHQDFPLSKRMW